jgi:MYXO-CTERM domain-containing protein
MRAWTRMLVIAIGMAALGVAWPAGPAGASGGGGCGRPITEATGREVRIKDFCFRPTVLRAAVGQTITWVNRDPFQHNVLGANGAWGSFESLHQDEMVSYRFQVPGVYPFACTLHPGMVGSIRITNAVSGGVGVKVEPTSVVPVSLTQATTAPLAVDPPRPIVRVERSVSSPVGWQVAAGSSWALLLGAAAGLWSIRRKRRQLVRAV